MSNPQPDRATKTCQACYAEIDRRATKCGHCQSYQGFLRVAAFAGIIGGAVVLILLSAGLAGLECDLLGKLRRDDNNYADGVTIQSSQLSFGPPRYGSEAKIVSVVGRLQNNTPKVLRSVTLKVEVDSAESQLLDVFTGTVGGPIQPNEACAFRVDGNPIGDRSEAEFTAHRILVKEALAH